MTEGKNAIVVENLKKSFKNLTVLKGISFEVKKGSIFALLGPNGAGKTTTIRILSTLLLPDSGKIRVNGFEVLRNPDDVRRSIGLTGQFSAVDEFLTGEENLKMIARLYKLTKTEADKRAKELLKRFDLVDAGKRQVKTYSGGMKRRLDLAMSLIASPSILFLDEPTTGLDPRSRITLWEIIKGLAKEGTTIVLTTQYMDEADALADTILVIDNGKVIAKGSSLELKRQVGSERLELTISKESDFMRASKLFEGKKAVFDEKGRVLRISTKEGISELKEILRQLDKEKIDIEDVCLHRPTLNDVFLTLTGRAVSEETQGGKDA